MAGFRRYGELDDPLVTDGDREILGFNSYIDPDRLPPGYLQHSTNMRCDGRKISLRNGVNFKAGMSGVTPTYTYSENDEEVFGSGLYSDPDDDKKDWLVSATKQAALIWDGTDTYYVNYYSADIASGSVDHPTDVWGAPVHKFNTGDAVQLTTTGSLPAGVTTAITYYVIEFSTSSIQLASSYDNALAGTQINITSAGSGTHTVQSIVDSTHEPEIRQAFNEVYIMRYKGRPLVWDGVTTATGDVVDSKFESLSSSATLRGGGTATGDPFPDTNITAYIANRLIGVQPREIATPTGADTSIGGITDSSTVILSDLLEPNNYTPSDSEWYVNQGAADYVVGFMPYQENNMVIFNRRSLTVATNVQQTSISTRYQLTTRYGCVAKRTIAQAGGFTFFLSDEGVMQLNPALDAVTQAGAAVSKLQGAVVPISNTIQNLLDNGRDPEKACAIIHDNKYYLATEILSRGNETYPDGFTFVYVYDILNEAWVSIDQYPNMMIRQFVQVQNSAGNLSLVACTPKGWYLFDDLGQGDSDDTNRTIGSSAESDTTQIDGNFLTRSYTFGTDDIKDFHEVQVAADVINADAFSTTITTTDPDNTDSLGTYTHSGSNNDVVRRLPTRLRGHNAYVKVRVTAGSPDFRYIRVSGTRHDLFGGRSLD